MLALFLYRTKRAAPDEEDRRSQDALLPGVGPRLKYMPHRCCPACLNHVRPTQKDQHRGQNPLLIPLLHGFRRMTARRRLDGKVSQTSRVFVKEKVKRLDGDSARHNLDFDLL